MTIPAERTRAVQNVRKFLRDLMDRTQTKRIPAEVRKQARQLLRHFPSDFDIEKAAKKVCDTFAVPDTVASSQDLEYERWVKQTYKDRFE